LSVSILYPLYCHSESIIIALLLSIGSNSHLAQSKLFASQVLVISTHTHASLGLALSLGHLHQYDMSPRLNLPCRACFPPTPFHNLTTPAYLNPPYCPPSTHHPSPLPRHHGPSSSSPLLPTYLFLSCLADLLCLLSLLVTSIIISPSPIGAASPSPTLPV